MALVSTSSILSTAYVSDSYDNNEGIPQSIFRGVEDVGERVGDIGSLRLNGQKIQLVKK